MSSAARESQKKEKRASEGEGHQPSSAGSRRAQVYNESPYPLLLYWFGIPLVVLTLAVFVMHLIGE